MDTYCPGIARLYRNLRDDRLVGQPGAETPFGFRLAGNRTMTGKAFEPEEIRLFRWCLAHAAVCVDIGANIGLYSCIAASLSKHVISVEPLPTNLRYLYRNLQCNGYEDAEVYPIGLSSHTGLITLYGGGTGASFIPGWAHTPTNWRTTVPVSTLDNLLGRRFEGAQLVIKIDVEGFEYEVLEGAESTLGMTPSPLWLIEICLDEHHPQGINSNFADTFALFFSQGYEATSIDEIPKNISRDDVDRWTKMGHVDFGTHNYLFSRGSFDALDGH